MGDYLSFVDVLLLQIISSSLGHLLPIQIDFEYHLFLPESGDALQRSLAWMSTPGCRRRNLTQWRCPCTEATWLRTNQSGVNIVSIHDCGQEKSLTFVAANAEPIELGYQKDNNAAEHSIDIYIFYAVIHLHLHVWWRISGKVWQGIMTKKHLLICTVFEYKKNTHRFPLCQTGLNCRIPCLSN